MTTILPQPTTPQPLPSSGPAAPVATIPNAPPLLTQQPVGALIRAEIVQILSRGLLEAQTDFGTVQLRTNTPLIAGSQIELQITKPGPQLQLGIRTIEQPRSLATGVTAAPAAPPSVQPQPPALSVLAPPLAVGSVIRAVVASPNPGATAPPPGSSQPASANLGQTPSPPTTSVPAQQRYANSGTPFDVRVTALASAGQALPTLAPSRPDAIRGTVTAFTPAGQPVLETSLGLLTLEAAPADVRAGTQVQLIPLAQAPRTAEAAPSTSRFPETFVQTRTWPALEEAVTHLAERASGADGQTTTPPIPQANRHLAANILQFLTALKGSNLTEWLGDSANVLERERPDLGIRANEEFLQLARLLSEAPVNDWRTAIVPFLNGAHLEPIRMHLRGGKSENGKKGDDEGSRFIIDIQLSQLGRLQFDGFVKKRGTDKKTFDLVIRSDRPLPQHMRFDINQIFNGFSEASGLAGAITFQARGKFVDVPMHRLALAPASGLVV